MNSYSDHHFSIGEQHLKQGKPCQDHALSGSFENISFAIVSDGCSGGKHTDVGARFTTFSTALAIRNQWSTTGKICEENFPQEIDVKLNIIQRGTYHMLGLTREDMLATCLYACLAPDGGFIHVLGDGVIAWKSESGAVYMRRFDWAKNTPLYPIYGENNYIDFIKCHGGDLSAPALTSSSWMHTPENGYICTDHNTFTIAEGIKGFTELFSARRIKERGVRFLAVFSDGATQVNGKDWKDTVVELLAFKGVAGDFVKRRTISFLKGGAASAYKPVDDLSCAVIHIGSSDEKE